MITVPLEAQDVGRRMSDVGTVLIVEGVEKRFHLHAAGKVLPSLSPTSLTATAGRLTALVGPSGAGKSTLLKCIHRTYLPSAGRILLQREHGIVDLAITDERTVLDCRRRDLGFVTQFLHALPRQGALDVVAAPLRAQGVPREAARARAAEGLRALGLPERLWDLPPATFSGGEKQRVNLARGLAVRPRLLLLDEPTASLDRASVARAVAAIGEAKRAGTAIVAIFHDPDLVAALADHVVELVPAARPEAA